MDGSDVGSRLAASMEMGRTASYDSPICISNSDHDGGTILVEVLLPLLPYRRRRFDLSSVTWIRRLLLVLEYKNDDGDENNDDVSSRRTTNPVTGRCREKRDTKKV